MKTPKITESEYRFCMILWDHEPIQRAALVWLCQEKLGWKDTVTNTVINRLSDRGVIKSEHDTVSALFSRNEIPALAQGTSCNGSLPAFIAACPLAFGETGIRQRIRSVLYYKKPGRILIATGVLLLFLVSVCFLTNPTGDGGIGIQNIRIVSHPTAAAALELDYLLMEKSGYTVRAVPQSEGEYTGDGMAEYDGALGPYRILISFGDTEPSEGFRQKYPAGEVIALENLPEHFLGSYLKFKVVSPQDHGFAIYVGSDRPFAFKESVLYNLRYLGGTLTIRLYNVAV